MCGLAGAMLFSGSDFALSDAYLARMGEAVAHRGPDGSGVWISPDRRVGLAHRRLAIIDRSAAAAQPMSTADGRFTIAYNGEIYNHAELRVALERTGRYVWRTDHSDTEVLVHAFAEWGIDCLARLRGMFAFALWDAARRELWLVRDRIGIKPLYHSRHHGRLVFASEIKALLTDPDQERRLDETALFHYLSFLTTPAPSTLFAGIAKLAPGTWLRARPDGDVRVERYWDALDEPAAVAGLDDDALAERVLAELRTSVALRKLGDVPVGVFLSGGVDSSTNAALFSEGEAAPVKTFSIGFDRDYPSYANELDYARDMAAMIGAEHHERRLGVDDLIAFLPRMVWLQDEPIADPVCVPLYYVAELARRAGVVVCQVGEGADELFCGYPLWLTFLRLSRLNALPVPRFAKRLALGALGAFGDDRSWAFEFLRRGTAGVPIFWGGAEGFPEAAKRRLLGPRLRRTFAGLSSWEAIAPIRRRFEAKRPGASELDWMSYLDLNLRLPELLLMRVDKMTMGCGLEARVPFLDHAFVSLAMGIPAAAKLRDGRLKAVLKRAVHGLVPETIIERAKQGFNVPVHEWVGDRLRAPIASELGWLGRETDLFDRAEIARLLDRSDGFRLWVLFNFALWYRRFIAGAA